MLRLLMLILVVLAPIALGAVLLLASPRWLVESNPIGRLLPRPRAGTGAHMAIAIVYRCLGVLLVLIGVISGLFALVSLD